MKWSMFVMLMMSVLVECGGKRRCVDAALSLKAAGVRASANP
jgi:hypothetical protein